MPCEPCQKKMDELEAKLAESNEIIKKTLRAIPVGYLPNHTPENLPELVEGWIKEVADLGFENDRLDEENEKLKLQVRKLRNKVSEKNRQINRAWQDSYESVDFTDYDR